MSSWLQNQWQTSPVPKIDGRGSRHEPCWTLPTSTCFAMHSKLFCYFACLSEAMLYLNHVAFLFFKFPLWLW